LPNPVPNTAKVVVVVVVVQNCGCSRCWWTEYNAQQAWLHAIRV